MEKLVEKLKQIHKLIGNMKRSFLFTLLCGAALVSCETNNIDSIQNNDVDYNKRVFTIISDNSNTRAVFNGTNGSLWKATDKIGVACTYGRYGYVTDETIQPFSISNAGDAEMIEIGEFTGALTDKGSKTYVYYAYAPYSEGVSTDNLEEVPCTLSPVQYPTATSWDSEADYMVAYPVVQTSNNVGGNNDLGFRFTRVFGMLRLSFDESWTSLYGDKKVKSVAITAGENDKLAGDFTLDIMNEPSETSTQIVRYTMSSNASNSIKLDYTDKNILFKDLQAYFMLNSGTYENVEIVVALEGVVITANRPNLTITRGALLSAPVSKKVEDNVVDVNFIEITEPGTLTRTLELLEVKTAELTELSISGTVNSSDIKTIRTMKNLTSLNMGKVTIIAGGDAYYNSYTTSNNEIGDYMFYNMPKLQTVILPYNIISIGVSSFENCFNLKTVNIPLGVSNINNRAFYNCSKLENPQNILSNITTIGSYAFYNCRFQELIIPSTVKEIGDHAFMACGIKSLIIPDGVTRIGTWAFGANFGEYTYINYLYMNNIDRTLGDYIFGQTMGFVEFAGTASPDGHSLIIGDTLIAVAKSYYKGVTNYDSFEYTIPSGVKKIGDYCFAQEDHYGSGSWVRGNMKIILNEDVTHIGKSAFRSCILKDFYPNLEHIETIDDLAFYCSSFSNKISLNFTQCLKYIGEYAFAYSNIDAIYLNSITPPTLVISSSYNESPFIGVDEDSDYIDPACDIYIPQGSRGTYLMDINWSSIAYDLIEHQF